jgi:hypothetical protein
VAATTNLNNVIALIGVADKPGESASVGAFLRSVLVTIRTEKPQDTRPETPDEVLNSGADLRKSYALWGALTGHEVRFLLNKQLMTEADNSFVAAVPVEPALLMQGLRQALENAGNKASVITVVFDGKSAHTINVTSYDPEESAFTYWDPWGAGSFLAKGSNVAGIAATADPSQKRFWIVKSDQLSTVIYAIELEFDDMLKLAASLPLGTFGALGERINDAKRTDLFTWFHLEQTESAKNSAGHEVTTFRSSGQFRALASLDLTTDNSGRLLAADLRLLRSFVNDQANTVFARDFANSLIRLATSGRDKMWTEPLMNQIEYDVPGHTTVFMHGGPSVTLPEHRTEDYLAFLGEKQEVTRELSLTRLKLTNIGTGKDSFLLISIESMR